MGRKYIRKWIQRIPDNFYFSSKNPSKEKDISLTISEFEAMRLKHYNGFNQKEAAEKMGVSQPTFSRILGSAHNKITKSLINGKNIKVYIGNLNYHVSSTGYGCLNCDLEWEDASASRNKKIKCIRCNSKRTYYIVREETAFYNHII